MVGKGSLSSFSKGCFMQHELFEYRVEPDVQDPRRPDPQTEIWFTRAKTGSQDLVDAFSRFCSTKTGSFERLLRSWVSGRRRENLPVNLEDPDSSLVPPRLKKSLRAGYNKVRKGNG